jgi:hypothetical protein
MSDKTWFNLSDLKFVFKKKETWLTVVIALLVGVALASFN